MARFPSCIMGTCVIPWSQQYDFQEDLFRHQVSELLRVGTKHLYLFGTAGEGYAVTNRQFRKITRVFVEEMQRDEAEPMVGLISLSLPTIIERIEIASDLGVRQFQISLPGWGALSNAEVDLFFQETCGRFPDAQFLHYNLLRAKRLITPEEYGRLADRHANLVATKNSTDSMLRIQGLITHAPQLQHFLNETGYLYGSMLRECGLLISVAATNWKTGRAYFEAGLRKDFETLTAMHRELVPLVAALIEAAGPGEKIDGAYDKILWKLHDERFPLRLLPPYTAATDEGFQKFRETLREQFPAWAP